MIIQFLIGATITLTWDSIEDTSVTHVRIYGSNELNTPQVLMGEVPVSSPTATITVKPMLQYDFVARSYNANNTLESADSNHVVYTKPAKLEIRRYMNGPLEVIELAADVYQGMPYEIQGTRDFLSWQGVSSGTAGQDRLVVPFNPDPLENHLFFRLRKNVTQLLLTKSVQKLPALVEAPIPPLEYREPTRWQRVKYFFRYRPGHHFDSRKGAERLMDSLKPARQVEIPMPPIPLRVNE